MVQKKDVEGIRHQVLYYELYLPLIVLLAKCLSSRNRFWIKKWPFTNRRDPVCSSLAEIVALKLSVNEVAIKGYYCSLLCCGMNHHPIVPYCNIILIPSLAYLKIMILKEELVD